MVMDESEKLKLALDFLGDVDHDFHHIFISFVFLSFDSLFTNFFSKLSSLWFFVSISSPNILHK